MANLNLSQFTEKTLVADADWVFVWDTAGAISKKVSRNSLLNSGTLATSAPVTISQTWDAVAQTFKALVVNAAGTSDANSAAASLLLDLQVNGTSKAWVTKQGGYRASIGQFVSGNGIGFAGGLNTGFYSVAGEQIFVAANNAVPIEFKATSVVVNSTTTFGFGQVGVGADTILVRDSASGNTLALRNGAAAQTFNVYGTYTSGSAYARLAIACDTSGNATLTTQSTGTAGTVSINGVPVGLGKGNVSGNVAIGVGTLTSNTTGSSNIAIGNTALRDNTTGANNSGYGGGAIRSNAGGNNNSALGFIALVSNQYGNFNSAVGSSAGAYITDGSTGNNNGSNSLFLGALTKAAADNQTNQIVIGYDATGLGSNTAVLGNASITTTALRGNVGIGTTAPSSKLQVSAGDVEVDTIAKGVILKSPDGTRYRVTVANGGTLSVAAV